MSAVTQATRELFGNLPPGPTPEAWSLQHPARYTLAWVALLLAVFVPLATARYARSARR